MANAMEEEERHVLSRRNLMKTAFSSFLLGAASLQAAIPASAAEEKTSWRTGKEPIVPGKKPRDKNDVSGTKKDPNFLRSLSDCKNQCETNFGPDGYARSKEDCLSDCQDVCCTTYQQCTFAIVPRI
jgi:hypothetical protein